MSPAELTKILSERIANFKALAVCRLDRRNECGCGRTVRTAIAFLLQEQADVQEVGRVLSVGDGIARIYGLKGVKARFQTWHDICQNFQHGAMDCPNPNVWQASASYLVFAGHVRF